MKKDTGPMTPYRMQHYIDKRKIDEQNGERYVPKTCLSKLTIKEVEQHRSFMVRFIKMCKENEQRKKEANRVIPKNVYDQVKYFINFIFEPDDIVEFRMLSKRGDTENRPFSHWIKAKDVLNIFISDLVEINNSGYNIYAGVMARENEGNREDVTCRWGRVAWVDFDNTTVDEMLRRIRIHKLPPPKMVICSGNGGHGYWKFEKKRQPQTISKTCQRLAYTLGSDDVSNPSRIMRVPGFINHKEPKTRCYIVY